MDVITGEFRDLSGCNLLALNRDGRKALLCGKRTYGLISICDPLQLVTKVPRDQFSKKNCEVTDVKFSRSGTHL